MAAADQGGLAAAPAGDDLAAAVAPVFVAAAGPVYVGFSGGLDSTVLLHAAVRAGAHAQLVALHVNHGLHPDAGDWQRHCERIAAGLGIECVSRPVCVERRGSLESAARAARYAVFAEYLAVPGSRVLLAHHRDDQVETVLQRLLQGRGLYGMPAERRLAAGRVLRPLLGHSRAELERYALAAGLTWLEDPANADLAIDRNYVRHRVLPELRRRFPAVDGALLAAMAARRAVDAVLQDDPGAALAGATLPVDELLRRKPEERQALLRLWLAAHGHAIPTGRALRELIAQLGARSDRQPRLTLDRGEIRRFGGRLWLVPREPELAGCYSVSAPGSLRLPHGMLEIRADPAGFACNGSLEVRFRTGGESIQAGGHHRLVKQLLQARGVPPWARSTYPMLFDELGLAALPGLALRDCTGVDPLPRFRADWFPRG